MASSMAYHSIPSREVCRYFLSNVCRFGDNCMYSHDRTFAQPNNVCRFFRQGKCSYGDRCRYDHVRAKPQPSNVAPPIPFYYDAPLTFVATPPVGAEIEADPAVNKTTTSAGAAAEPMSYAGVCRLNNDVHESSIQIVSQFTPYTSFGYQPLCPYAEKAGACEGLELGTCPYVHGELCDLCEMPVLHPFDEQQREYHRSECLGKYQAECEEAFAIQRSEDKTCGVCLETVWDRDGDKRFGILENCDHIFCLECIRKWRASSSYDNRVVKACPECRVKSDFVTPTKYWPENQESKEDLIRAYKENLRQIHCKFFNRGDGTCPFGSKCFYLHVDKNGRQVELTPPRRRLRMNARGELENYSDHLMFSIISEEYQDILFDEYDFLFDDEDEESDGLFSNDGDEYRPSNENLDQDQRDD